MTLTRRRSLILAATTPLAAPLFAPGIARAQPRRLRFGHNNAVDSVLHTTATVFATAVNEGSGGRLQVEVTPNSTLGTEVQMLKAAVEGTLDFTMAPIGTAATLTKEVGLVETPYLFRSVDQARTALDGALGAYCAELLRAKGVTVLAWGEIGLRHITANRPVRNPAELKGLVIRVPISEVMLESFKAMGAKPDILPFPQLPEALRTGRFEAQENPVNIIVAAKLNTLQSHLSRTGHAYTAGPILASTDVMEELSAADRALLAAAAQKGAQAGRAYATRMEQEGVQTLRTAGMTIVDDIDRGAFLALGAQAMETLAGSFGAAAVGRFRNAVS